MQKAHAGDRESAVGAALPAEIGILSVLIADRKIRSRYDLYYQQNIAGVCKLAEETSSEIFSVLYFRLPAVLTEKQYIKRTMKPLLRKR